MESSSTSYSVSSTGCSSSSSSTSSLSSPACFIWDKNNSNNEQSPILPFKKRCRFSNKDDAQADKSPKLSSKNTSSSQCSSSKGKLKNTHAPDGDCFSNDKDSETEVPLSKLPASPKELKPAPFFYYTDHSREPDEDPLTPLTPIARVPNFPAKMHAILARADLSDVIAWMPHGRSWKILKPRQFEIRVLPTYFDHSKFSSFIRQANGWGFRRITQGCNRNSYYNELFLRGLPHLSKKMRRPGVSEKTAVNPDHEPNFYKISEQFPIGEKPFEDESILLECTVLGGPKARMPVLCGLVPPRDAYNKISSASVENRKRSYSVALEDCRTVAAVDSKPPSTIAINSTTERNGNSSSQDEAPNQKLVQQVANALIQQGLPMFTGSPSAGGAPLAHASKPHNQEFDYAHTQSPMLPPINFSVPPSSNFSLMPNNFGCSKEYSKPMHPPTRPVQGAFENPTVNDLERLSYLAGEKEPISYPASRGPAPAPDQYSLGFAAGLQHSLYASRAPHIGEYTMPSLPGGYDVYGSPPSHPELTSVQLHDALNNVNSLTQYFAMNDEICQHINKQKRPRHYL